ncbi:MAG: oxygen-independent coproporphyrinogen III oxidase [Cyclobacteriaceae bacterium]|jgi:oxygen-independent coproporphyrinogen-3 oxidase|nr:oxygen-independent coproporphyrinogen III oxidase [Cyclobacteriaceae bacterium]
MSNYSNLLKKYDVPVPRYTSYPTVPAWQTQHFSVSAWKKNLKHSFDEVNKKEGISLYIHLPFCESLCTYCACNTRITKNHQVEEKYIKALLHEWSLYKTIFNHTPIIRELHIGGGTPTFFRAGNLKFLINKLLEDTQLHPDFEFSVEGHPNNTTEEHIDVFHQLGFNRISFGVQDLDPIVQKAIHRIQPFSKVENVFSYARRKGFNSISFDLVYGLPFQTIESIRSTMDQVIKLQPDRISFYSYAHVPWLKPGQRGYEDADLPTDVRKRELYETGKNLLLQHGYLEIGMDHFALPTDTLYVAQERGKLNRNFMGYTTSATSVLIGLGVSSISETNSGYAQNEKNLEEYYRYIQSGLLPIVKGHLQSEDDKKRKTIIKSIICRSRVSNQLLKDYLTDEVTYQMQEMIREGIITLNDDEMLVTKKGKTFVRNVCNLFDAYSSKQFDAYSSKQKETPQQIFSKSI